MRDPNVHRPSLPPVPPPTIGLKTYLYYLVELLLVSKHGPDLLPLIFNVLLKGAELLLHDAILPLQSQS